MTPEELEWHKDNAASAAKQIIDINARITVLAETLVGVICELRGEDPVSVLAALQEKMRSRAEEHLLRIETTNPGLAARMDKDRPGPT